MNLRRRLSLKSESLTELNADDLRAVAGGANAITAHPCVTEESARVCSLFCQWTVNTCEAP